MPSLYPSFLRFGLYFFAVTCGFGLFGILLTLLGFAFLIQLLSYVVLLPYLISFYLMTQHYLKNHQAIPPNKQRWQLSLGCLIIFWLYTLFTILINLYLSNTEFNFMSIQQLFAVPSFAILIGFAFCSLNLLLLILGYAFLGKPAKIMLSQQKHS